MGIDFVSLVVALLVATLLLLIVVTLMWWMDRYDREPLHLVGAALLWGGIAAPAAALAIDGALDAVGTGPLSIPVLSTVAAAATLEEVLKAVGVVLVVLVTRHFDNPADGLVYGTAVGLGFAVTENGLHGMPGTMWGPTGAAIGTVAARAAFSVGLHALSTATFGGFLGVAYLARRPAARVGWLAVGLGAASLLHGAWTVALLWAGAGTAAGLGARWLVALPGLYGLYMVSAALFVRSEHRILRDQLQEEERFGVVPGWVVDVVPYYWRRVRAEWWPVRRERTIISRLLTRLAFRKHALRRRPPGEAEIAGLEVVQLRQQIKRIFEPEPDDHEA